MSGPNDEVTRASQVLREASATYAATTERETSAEEALAIQRGRKQDIIQLLRSWRECTEEDAQEQRETWEYLQRVLDEDRPSFRKLFP